MESPYTLNALRWYQDDAVRQIRQCYKEGKRRVILCLATGGGKSEILLNIASKAVDKGSSILLFTDRRGLTRQLHGRAVSSGFDAGIMLAGYYNESAYPFQIAGKQTFLSRVHSELPPADIICIDECHRGIQGYQPILDRYPNAYMLMLTATPILPNGQGMGAYADAIVCPVQPSQLLSEGYLVPAVCYAPDVPDLKGVKTGPDGEWVSTQLAERMSAKNLVGNTVREWKKHLQGRKTLGFACNRAHAQEMVKLYKDENIRTGYLDQHSTDQEFDDQLGALREGRLDIVWNVAKCVEGIDVPEIDAVQLFRPFRKIVMPWQIFGRAMRPAPWVGKKDMVVVDHAGVVLLHGLPGTDVDWPFDASDGCVEQRREKETEPGEPKLVACPACGFVFSAAPSCPRCKNPLRGKLKTRSMGNQRGELVLASRSKLRPENLTADELLKHWRSALFIAVAKNGSFRQAAMIFKGKTERLPWEADVHPLPDPGVKWDRKVAEVMPEFVRRKASG